MTYPGGKAGDGVYQSLINLMPPHQTYIEPFVGSGAILRLKRPAARNIGVDMDPAVIAWWRNVGQASWPVRRPPSPAGSMPDPAIEPGRSPIANSRVAVLTAGPRDVRFMFAPSQRVVPGVPSPTIIHGDGIQFLRSYPLTASDLVYCDPPYLLSTRPSGARYACEMTDAQHQELLDVLNRLPCMAMISGYSSVLYARELKTWNAYSFAAATRGKPAAEWVWCNFPRPVELHDYRFAGSTYREREKLKRRQVTWERKLERMSPVERQILKSALQHF